MSWAKIDDQFYLNPKNDTISRDEQDLYLAGLVYCNGQLTDGFIPDGKIALLAVWAKLPIEANAQALACLLVEHCYWERSTGGYTVHDFLDWNMSREEVLAMKTARSEAGKRGGIVSAEKRKAKQANVQAIATANVQAKSKQSSTPSPSPSPIYEPVINKVIDNGISAEKAQPKQTSNLPQSEPRSKHPAIIAYREIVKRYPKTDLFDIVIDALGNSPNTPKAKACWVEWMARGYNTNSVKWLEWYRNGIPPKNGKSPIREPERIEEWEGRDE